MWAESEGRAPHGKGEAGRHWATPGIIEGAEAVLDELGEEREPCQRGGQRLLSNVQEAKHNSLP